MTEIDISYKAYQLFVVERLESWRIMPRVLEKIKAMKSFRPLESYTPVNVRSLITLTEGMPLRIIDRKKIRPEKWALTWLKRGKITEQGIQYLQDLSGFFADHEEYFTFEKNTKRDNYRQKARKILEEGHDLYDTKYIFHFWQEQTLYKGLVEIPPKKDWLQKPAFISIYQLDQSEKEWKMQASSKNNSSKAFFISETKDYITVSVGGELALSFVMNKGNTAFVEQQFVFCGYNLLVRNKIIAGIGLMQKSEFEFEPTKVFHVNSQDNPIYNVLFQRSNTLREKEMEYNTFKSEKTRFDFDNDFSTEIAKHFIGSYKGYYLDKDFSDGVSAIRTLLLKIEESGRVIIDEGKSNRKMSGFCSLSSNFKVLYITCDYIDAEQDVPRFVIILELPQSNNKDLEGVYGGYSVHNKPYIGLIRLERLAAHAKSTAGKFLPATIKPQSFSLKEQKGTKFSSHIPHRTIQYFINEKFYNSPQICLSSNFFTGINRGDSPGYKGPIGFFSLFSCSATKREIVEYPLRILSNGTVMLKSNDGLERGTARLLYGNNFLQLSFEPQSTHMGRPSKGEYLLHIHNKHNFSLASGVSIRINGDDKPQAKREFMYVKRFAKPLRKSPDGDHQFPSEFVFEVYKPRTTAFETLEIPKELKKTLLGREYNLIVVSKDKTFSRENFAEIYLHQALFEYQKAIRHKMKDFSLASNFLNLSIEHGLLSIDQLKDLIHEFCNVWQLDPKKIEVGMRKLYKAIVNKNSNDYQV